MTANATRGCYLSTAELHRLDLACAELARFARADDGYGGVYLVGSASERPDFRDVDVRLILMDDTFDRLFGHSPMLWGIFCYAVSRQLAADTGLPIDFQVQRCTEANEVYKPVDGHRRNPLGHHQRDFAGRGDATRFVETTGRYADSAIAIIKWVNE